MNPPDLGEHRPVPEREAQVEEPVGSRADRSEEIVRDLEMILSAPCLQLRSPSSPYQFGVESKRDNCKQAEDDAHQDEVITAGVGVHDDPPVVELVVDKDEDDGENDPDDADGEHGNVESHGDCPDVRLDDGPVLGRDASPPPDNLLTWNTSIINRGQRRPEVFSDLMSSY